MEYDDEIVVVNDIDGGTKKRTSKQKTKKRSFKKRSKRSSKKTSKKTSKKSKAPKRGYKKPKPYSGVPYRAERGCTRQTSKKYRERNSPPYPANLCCGSYKAGNDGDLYKSIRNAAGICTWRKSD